MVTITDGLNYRLELSCYHWIKTMKQLKELNTHRKNLLMNGKTVDFSLGKSKLQRVVSKYTGIPGELSCYTFQPRAWGIHCTGNHMISSV